MNLYDLSAHYHDEHMIQFHDEYVDALQTWQEVALDFADKDTRLFLTYAYKNLMVTLSVSKTKNRH